MRTWILQRYATYARMVVLAALFLSAIWFWRPTIDVFDLTKITILWVLALLALVLWFMSAAERGVWLPKLKLFWAAGAFLAAEAIATILSQDPALSLTGLYHRYGGLIPFCLYATIGLMLVGLYWERPQDLKEVARAIALAAVFVTGYVLIEKAGLDWIPWRDSNGNPPAFPVSTLGNSDFAGGYLAITSSCFLYVVLSARNFVWKLIFAGLFVLDLLALYYTDSRGAFIAVGVVIAAMAFLYRDRLPRWVRLGALAGVILAVLTGIIALFHPFMKQAPALFSQAGQFSPFRTGTFQERSWYWIDALRIFKHHPVFGTGPDTYYANYPRFRLPQDGAKLALTITDKPHNIFLEYAADSGFLGIGTYLAMMGLGLWYGYRRVRQLDGGLRLLLVTFIAMMVAYLAQGFFSIDIPPLAVLGWVALACVAVLADPGGVAQREAIEAERAAKAKGGVRPKKKKPGGVARSAPKADPYRGVRVLRRGPWRWWVGASALVVAIVLIVIGVKPFYADVVAHDGQVAQATQGESPLTVAGFYEHAHGIWPLEPSYPSMAGQVFELEGNNAGSSSSTSTTPAAAWYSQALIWYRKSYNLQPQNVFYVMNIARVYSSWAGTDASKFPLAQTYWKKAIAIDPTDWQVHQQYAQMLDNWANADTSNASIRQAAVAQLKEVVSQSPGQAASWVDLIQLDRSLNQTAAADSAYRQAIKDNPGNTQILGVSQTATATPTSTATSTATPTAGG
ncbi:MAG TPA: O-antigen ligase family protein [Actinomycetota bacterium]|nr:O-antigen ligase family protein [Actinomycetota bacterium]